MNAAEAPTVRAFGRVESSRLPRRPAPFDQPRFLRVITALVFVYLFAPIVVVVWYSFNSKRSIHVFGNFSLRWYDQLFHDPGIVGSLVASIEVALVTTVVATTIGTLLAFGIVRAESRATRPTEVLMVLNLVSPEIATGIAFLLLFSQLAIPLSLTTVAIGHITFSIAYVTIIVRGRLASINAEVEEAAQDLGATNFGAVRLVTLPLLWPAIVASGMLVFVMSFDDFVTSFFTSGVGTSLLPIRIYGMIHFGVTPEVNAVGTLMMLLTVLIVLGALFVYSRQRKARLDFLAE